VALLLMGFLAVFGVGMSRLIVNSIRVERNVVDAGSAYFAAEAGVERGLYLQDNSLPGYEVEETVTLLNGLEMTYQLEGAGASVPCMHRGEEWRVLTSQESITLPLFSSPENTRVDVSAFTLHYEVADEDVVSVVNRPVLRWKILGFDDVGGHTEAISDLLDYRNGLNSFDENFQANFYDGAPGYTFANFTDYPISDFLAGHDFNYLTLTNVTSAHVPFNIRLEVEGGESACEFALIRGDATKGDARQSIDAQVRLDSFLPVFDFVLYHVD